MLGAEALEALSSHEGTGISIDPAAASAALEDALLAHSQDWIALYIYIYIEFHDRGQTVCMLCMQSLHAYFTCVCMRLYAHIHADIHTDIQA